MSSLNPIEELHDRLSDLELNIIEHLDRNAQFARKQEKRLVELFHIDPTTISREPSSVVVASDKNESNFRKLAEKLIKESVIELRDNIKNTFEIYQEKRFIDAKLQTPFNNEERMFELLSIYALNLIPLITSLSLVPEYKKTILKIIQDINQTISSIESEIRDEYIGRFDSQIKTIILKLFQLPSPNSAPIILKSPAELDDLYKSKLYDLLRSNQPPLGTLLAPSKVFLLQFKTFLEKLITLYEQVEERTSGKGITIAKKYKLRVNTTNKKLKNFKKINKSRKHRKSHKRKQRRQHKRTKRNNKTTTKFKYPPQ